jgi:hypothetical protein
VSGPAHADTKTVPCSRPLSNCPPIGLWDECVFLDLPNEPQRSFCNLSCLWAWLQHRVTEPREGEPVSAPARHYWLSNERMTVWAKTDASGTIVQTAPITRVFTGQKLSNLASWMRKARGFQFAEIALGEGGTNA